MISINQSSVLIIGGAGFVGSNLVKRLIEENVVHIHIIDNLLSAEKDNIPTDSRITFTEGSIADDAILAQLSDAYDFIFHIATYHGNQSSIHDPIADHDNNLITTLKLFEKIKNFKRIQKVVYAGAGCAVAHKTYGEASATYEDAPISLEMDSPYSISKIVGEFYAVYYYNHHKLPTVRARFQNVYGPGEILGAGQWRGTPATVWRNVTPTFIYRALKGLPLWLDGGGIASRDFIFVDDIVEGLVLCATKGTPGDVYNLASGVETTILELAHEVNRLTNNAIPLEVGPIRDWDRSGKRFGSYEKALQQLGFRASTSVHDGLAKTIQWTQTNLNWIEKTMAKHAKFM